MSRNVEVRADRLWKAAKTGLAVCMTRAVNVTVVTRVGFVLDVCRVDRDATGFFFRGLVNFGVIRELGATQIGENLGNGSRQSCLAVVDVSLIVESSVMVEKPKMVNYLWCQCSCEVWPERISWSWPRHTPLQELPRALAGVRQGL